MIRTLALAAAAAAVGFAIGQRAGDDEESRFSRPEVTGDEVVVKDSGATLSDDLTRRSRADIDNPYDDWERFGDADGRIGR